MSFIDVSNENIIQKTKDFIEKAKTKMEKPKDEPRYKTIVQYEKQFKELYSKGLSVTMKAILKKYNESLTGDVTTTS